MESGLVSYECCGLRNGLMFLSWRPGEFMEERIVLTLGSLALVQACPFLSRPHNRAVPPWGPCSFALKRL